MRQKKLGRKAWNKGLKGKGYLIHYSNGHPRGMLGKHHTEGAKKKQSLKGKNNPNWQGGISFEPYGKEFNKNLKKQIRKRDNYRCQECFRHQNELFRKVKGRKIKPYKLYIHHIDYNKQNNNPSNLISLCLNCHMQTNYDKQNWMKYFQNKIKEFIKK